MTKFMNQRGFVNIAFVIVIVVLTILIVGSGVYLWQKSSLSKEITKQSQQAQEEIPSQSTGTEKAKGYIKAVYDKNGKNYLDIDFVQWLSHSDGTCSLTSESSNIPKCNPNGYLIVNQNPKIRTFEISRDAEITMQTYASGQCYVQWNEKVNYTTFKSFWGSSPACMHLKSLPYNIEAQNDVITKIIEQYIP